MARQANLAIQRLLVEKRLIRVVVHVMARRTLEILSVLQRQRSNIASIDSRRMQTRVTGREVAVVYERYRVVITQVRSQPAPVSRPEREAGIFL